MKILLLFLSLFACSVSVEAWEYYPFGAVTEWESGCTFWFYDDDRNDDKDKGTYQFSYAISENNQIDEKGIYEAQQTQDEYRTTTILITIQESTIQERVGVSFSCTCWYHVPNNWDHSSYFSNATQLTCGIATADTILTYDVKTSSADEKKWSEVKRLFQTK